MIANHRLPPAATGSGPSRIQATHDPVRYRQGTLRVDAAPELLQPTDIEAGLQGHPLPPRPRIALYSHDTMGIGHVRRNFLIAQALTEAPLRATALLISGVREAGLFAAPPGVDCLTLPALSKHQNGDYHARRLAMSLSDLIPLRARAMEAALLEFNPDVLLVDKVPRGASCELDFALESLHRRGNTRIVLGLRDVLDDPRAVRADWLTEENERTICRYYDAIWVYGDRRVYDPVAVYGFNAQLAEKVHYTGYLDPQPRLGLEGPWGVEKFSVGTPLGWRLALCIVGGGQDGFELARAFAHAQLPADTHGLILTGPFMPAAERQMLFEVATRQAHLSVREFSPEADALITQADRVVSMGGYNSVSAALAHGKSTLVVPRVRPRTEQLIRARCFEQLGLLDVLHPRDLSAAAIENWLHRDAVVPHGHREIDFGGLKRVSQLVSHLVLTRNGARPQAISHPASTNQRPR